jgi:hypothetical protein
LLVWLFLSHDFPIDRRKSDELFLAVNDSEFATFSFINCWTVEFYFALKVTVFEGVIGCDPQIWIHLKELIKQINRIIFYVFDKFKVRQLNAKTGCSVVF